MGSPRAHTCKGSAHDQQIPKRTSAAQGSRCHTIYLFLREKTNTHLLSQPTQNHIRSNTTRPTLLEHKTRLWGWSCGLCLAPHYQPVVCCQFGLQSDPNWGTVTIQANQTKNENTRRHKTTHLCTTDVMHTHPPATHKEPNIYCPLTTLGPPHPACADMYSAPYTTYTPNSAGTHSQHYGVSSRGSK